MLILTLLVSLVVVSAQEAADEPTIVPIDLIMNLAAINGVEVIVSDTQIVLINQDGAAFILRGGQGTDSTLFTANAGDLLDAFVFIAEVEEEMNDINTFDSAVRVRDYTWDDPIIVEREESLWVNTSRDDDSEAWLIEFEEGRGFIASNHHDDSGIIRPGNNNLLLGGAEGLDGQCVVVAGGTATDGLPGRLALFTPDMDNTDDVCHVDQVRNILNQQ